jgi:hypothetical protein
MVGRREVLAGQQQHLLVEATNNGNLGLLRLVLGSCRFFLAFVAIFDVLICRWLASSRYICTASGQRLFC